MAMLRNTPMTLCGTCSSKAVTDTRSLRCPAAPQARSSGAWRAPIFTTMGEPTPPAKPPATPMSAVGTRERRRRVEALRQHREERRGRSISSAGELSYLRAQLRLAARLTAGLAATSDVHEMLQLLVEELHETFAFYLIAIQRLDEDGVLRLVAGSGPLAEVMTEFLLVEQSLGEGVNGRVARSGTSRSSWTRAPTRTTSCATRRRTRARS